MLTLNTFRAGDRVVVTAKDDFYAYLDGWRGRVVAIGPAAPNAVHSQVPEGYCVVMAERDEGRLVFLVPSDELALTVGR